MYWSGAGAGSSSASTDEGSIADDRTISAQYTGGSGIGGITPLVYNPESDGPPVFHSGVFTGDHGSVQFVQTADTGNQGTGEGDTSQSDDKSRARSWWGIQGWFLGDEPIDEGGCHVVQVVEVEGVIPRSTYSTPIMIGQGLWPFPQVFNVPPETAANLPERPRDAMAWTDAAGNRWNTDIGEISANGPPPQKPTLSQVLEACGSVLAAIGAGRAVQNRVNSQAFASRGIRPANLSPLDAGRTGAFNQAKRDSGIPTSQQPERVLPNLDRQGRVRAGRVYEYVVPGEYGTRKIIVIRDDAGGDFYGPGNPQNRGPHFNTESGGHYDY